MKFIQIAVVAMFLSSCTTIYFKTPQPDNAENLDSFPESYVGTYTSEMDTFIIGETSYSFPIVYERDYTLHEIDSNPSLRIENDLFFDNSIPVPEGIKYSIRNDSLFINKRIVGHRHISDSLILRKFKKSIVMSEQDKKNGYYILFLISEQGSNLKVNMTGSFKTEDNTESSDSINKDLSDFYKITNFEKLESNAYLVNPTYKEFQKLIKEGLFNAELDLIRCNDE